VKKFAFVLANSVLFASAALAEIDPFVSAEGKFVISSGFEYSSGKYGGTSSTDTLYVPITSKYVAGRTSYSLTVPYIGVTSSDQSVVPSVGRMSPSGSTGSGMGGGMGGSSGSGSRSNQSTQSGLGDIAALAGYDFYTGDQLWLTALGGVKFGTADSNKGLGTGQNDYSAELDGSYVMKDYSILGAVGYKVVGKPVNYTLNNIGYGSFGINHRVNENSRFNLMLNGAQSSNTYSSNRLALAVGWSRQVSNILGWSASLAKGLSDGSPDWDGWLSIYASY
jgi:hypothetical protein